MIVRLTLLDSFCTLHRFNTVCIFGQIFVVLTKSYPPSRSTMIECQIHVVLSPDLTPGQESSALPPPIWAFGLTDPSLGERFDLAESSLAQCSTQDSVRPILTNLTPILKRCRQNWFDAKKRANKEKFLLGGRQARDYIIKCDGTVGVLNCTRF